MCIDQHLNTRASDEAKMASIGSGSELEARALAFVKDAEKQLEEDAKKTAQLKRALAIVKDAKPEKQLEEAAKKTALLNESWARRRRPSTRT